MRHLFEFSSLSPPSLFPQDLRHICQNLDQFGHGRGTVYGGCSEFTIVPSRYAYRLTTDLDDARAAILERETYIQNPFSSVLIPYFSCFFSPPLLYSLLSSFIPFLSLSPSLPSLSLSLLSLSPSLPACGVAHQALEEIDPKGETILIQGPPFSRLLYLH